MKEICSTLLAHNEQTSVRYYCEWTVSVLLLSQQEDDLTDVWQWLERAAEEKVGSVPSFLMIITQYLWCRQVTLQHSQHLPHTTLPVCVLGGAGERTERLVSVVHGSELLHQDRGSSLLQKSLDKV